MHWMSESQRKQLGMTEASTDMVWFVVSTWIPQNFHGDRLDHEAVAPQKCNGVYHDLSVNMSAVQVCTKHIMIIPQVYSNFQLHSNYTPTLYI